MDQPRRSGPEPSLARRLLWFAALWLAGVAAIAAVTFLIRLALSA